MKLKDEFISFVRDVRLDEEAGILEFKEPTDNYQLAVSFALCKMYQIGIAVFDSKAVYGAMIIYCGDDIHDLTDVLERSYDFSSLEKLIAAGGKA